MTSVLASKSALETEEIGRTMGGWVKSGDVIALYGDLGAGKTIFVKGLASSLGVSGNVGSPSFTIICEYAGRLPLYHVDLFRIANIDEILEIGYEEYLYGEGVCVIEWAERLAGLLPAKRVDVRIFHTGLNERRVEITPRNTEMPPLPESLVTERLA